MSVFVEARSAAELALLTQIERFIGWLGRGEGARQKLAQVVATLRHCFSEEAILEVRIHTALKQLQQQVMRVRSAPIRKLLKVQVATLCRSRNVAVTWKANRPARPKM